MIRTDSRQVKLISNVETLAACHSQEWHAVAAICMTGEMSGIANKLLLRVCYCDIADVNRERDLGETIEVSRPHTHTTPAFGVA